MIIWSIHNGLIWWYVTSKEFYHVLWYLNPTFQSGMVDSMKINIERLKWWVFFLFFNPTFQLLKFSELTTTKLSSDNCLLKDELEMTRGQLVTAKKTLASLETQLETTKLETVGKEESEGRTRLQGEVWTYSEVGERDWELSCSACKLSRMKTCWERTS